MTFGLGRITANNIFLPNTPYAKRGIFISLTTADTIRRECKHAEISLHVVNKIIRLDYLDHNDTAIFDICSVEGKILLTGRLHELRDNSVDMQEFEDGFYNLFILDGEDIYKRQFQLPD